MSPTSSAYFALALLSSLAWGLVHLVTIGLAVAYVRTKSVVAMVLMIASACIHLFSSVLALATARFGFDVAAAGSIATNALSLIAHAGLVASCIVLATRKARD